jgi:hypothetical protein
MHFIHLTGVAEYKQTWRNLALHAGFSRSAGCCGRRRQLAQLRFQQQL